MKLTIALSKVILILALCLVCRDARAQACANIITIQTGEDLVERLNPDSHLTANREISPIT